MLILVIISLLLLVGYIVYVINEVGVPPTLSDSFYLIKYKWLFTLTLFFCAFTLLPAWIELSSPNTQFLSFFTCTSLCFIGASPYFKNNPDRLVHIGALVVCILSLIAWMIFNNTYKLILPFLLLGIVLCLKYKNKSGFILEMISFILAYISVLLNIF